MELGIKLGTLQDLEEPMQHIAASCVCMYSWKHWCECWLINVYINKRKCEPGSLRILFSVETPVVKSFRS